MLNSVNPWFIFCLRFGFRLFFRSTFAYQMEKEKC